MRASPVFCLFLAAACGSEREPPDSAPRDSGGSVSDSGESLSDTGVAPSDAGSPSDAAFIVCGAETCNPSQICVLSPACGGADAGVPCGPTVFHCEDVPASCNAPRACNCMPADICEAPGAASSRCTNISGDGKELVCMSA